MTSRPVASFAGHLLRTASSDTVKSVAGSALRQRARDGLPDTVAGFVGRTLRSWNPFRR